MFNILGLKALSSQKFSTKRMTVFIYPAEFGKFSFTRFF